MRSALGTHEQDGDGDEHGADEEQHDAVGSREMIAEPRLQCQCGQAGEGRDTADSPDARNRRLRGLP